MTDPLRPRVGIVGLGLIGGSLALALRESGFAGELLAWDRDADVLARGLERSVVDGAVDELEALLERVDLAILCTPSLASEELLRRMLRAPGRATCITDVASVKAPLCRAAEDLGPQRAARFVPGHPIAGSERSGVEAARADLFMGHRVILTPGPWTDGAALRSTHRLWEAAGAEVHEMSAEDHDAVLAATSHLPHVLAYALVHALAQGEHREDVFRFAAGGFRDFTRIASSDPVMWRDVALANRAALLACMDDFQHHLDSLRGAIDRGDSAELERTFHGAKTVRDEFARDLEARGVGRPRRDA